MTLNTTRSSAVADDRGLSLSHALRRLGAGPLTKVGVLICAEHTLEREVVERAIQSLGASLVSLSPEESPDALGLGLLGLRSSFLFACNEGVEAWRVAGAPPVRLVSNGSHGLWWPRIEQSGVAGGPEARMLGHTA